MWVQIWPDGGHKGVLGQNHRVDFAWWTKIQERVAWLPWPSATFLSMAKKIRTHAVLHSQCLLPGVIGLISISVLEDSNPHLLTLAHLQLIIFFTLLEVF